MSDMIYNPAMLTWATWVWEHPEKFSQSTRDYADEVIREQASIYIQDNVLGFRFKVSRS